MKRLPVIMLLLAALLVGCQKRENVKSFGTGAFSFSYELDGTFARGETVEVDVQVTNRQKESFKWVGSSTIGLTFVVCRENGFTMGTTLSGGNDDGGPRELAPGESGGGRHFFTLPKYAPAGSYCLVCLYGNEETFSATSFLDVFTLDGDVKGEPGEAVSFGMDTISFSYKADDGTLERGKNFNVDVEVTNLQSESIIVGSDFDMIMLVCRENGFLIHPEVPRYGWYESFSVAPGESCTVSRAFNIPDYAPAGKYCLVCICGGVDEFTETSFIDVFTLSD